MKAKTAFRIGWCVVWIAGMLLMRNAGMIAYRSFLSYAFEAILSCFVASFLVKHKTFYILTVLILIVYLFGELSITGIFCFIMSIGLLIATTCFPQNWGQKRGWLHPLTFFADFVEIAITKKLDNTLI